MVSVLIPTYDWDVSTLVAALHQQLSESCAVFEILVSDNASKSVYQTANAQLNLLPFCKYFIENVEVGRSANRNALARKAQYKWLLFLDGDTALPDGQFVQRYMAQLGKAPVICGGTVYQQQPPHNHNNLLRWRYGKAKEEVPAAMRQKVPYLAYSSFNFLIGKDLFFQIGFDAGLKQYGHEDTLFGRQLKTLQIPVLHINNPLQHLGLDTANDFLTKTRSGVENLYNLACKGKVDPEVKLFAWYQWILNFGLTYYFTSIYNNKKDAIEKQLTGKNPYMWLFDFYKLGYLCTLHERHQGLPISKPA